MSDLNSMYLILILTLTLLIAHAVVSSKLEAIDVLLDRFDSQRSSPSVQESAARAVLQRLLPAHVNSFEFKIVPKDVCGGHSCF
ncbi:hypothetical protein LWI28_022106 [Acer negundo]|uniref:Uncharacterized protein n=1 Tax=Acer negundo TaxID=4023 RepID=A0AAD5IMP3_ACENE|nr:hypothetical protein LWI28_022106 [Acer negundo]